MLVYKNVFTVIYKSNISVNLFFRLFLNFYYIMNLIKFTHDYIFIYYFYKIYNFIYNYYKLN